MTKLAAIEAISAGVVKEIIADNITAGNDAVYLGVWPAEITNSERADLYMIRPVTTDIYMVMGQGNTLMPVPQSTGTAAVRLFADTEYVIPIDPNVNTFGFVASGASANVEVYLRAFKVR